MYDSVHNTEKWALAQLKICRGLMTG